MKRTLHDTNVFIDWLNAGLHETTLFAAGTVRHLSAVVLIELRAAAQTRRARKALDSLVRAYASAGRIVAPPARAFDQAGVILQALSQRGKEVRRASLVNDVLIALTARSLGATLYTRNAGDFEAIRRVLDVDVRGAG